MTKKQKQIKNIEKEIIERMKAGKITKQEIAKEFSKIAKLAGI